MTQEDNESSNEENSYEWVLWECMECTEIFATLPNHKPERGLCPMCREQLVWTKEDDESFDKWIDPNKE